MKNPNLFLFYVCISFMLIWIVLIWYQSQYHGTRLNLKHNFRKSNWYFIFRLVSTNLILNLPFSFCNLVFAFCFLNFLFQSKCINLRKYLFNFYNLVSCFLLLRCSFLYLLIMTTEKDDSLLSMSVRLNGKKYLY